MDAMGAMGQHKVHTTDRLKRLRDLMRKEDVNVQAFVVPSEDQRTCTFHFLVEVIKNSFLL
jgi:Xaa-Pro aminopeptidase